MSLTCTINNVAVDFLSISRPDRIDQPTECTIVVQDSTGTAYYQKGQPVTIIDSNLGTIFTGVVNQPTATRPCLGAPKEWSLQCKSKGDYRAGKRTSNKSYKNQYAGTVVVDMVQRDLASEGITAKAALRWDELQTEWNGGTLSNCVATTNASNGNPGGGDLELALAGATVTITENTTALFGNGTLTNMTASSNSLAPTATSALKIVGTQAIPNNGNSFSYIMIWSGSDTISSDDYFSYWVWVDASSPEIKVAPDFVCDDDTTWRDNATSNDQQDVAPHPATDLSGFADGKWYYRTFPIGNFAGKNIAYVSLSIEGEKTGTYTAWIKGLYKTDSVGSIRTTYFNSVLNVNPPQQLQNNGYTNVSVSVVNTYDCSTSQRVSPSYSIATASLLKSSAISWKTTLPTGISFNLKYSLDGGNSYTDCTNNAALPNLPASLALAGKSIQFLQSFTQGSTASPEQQPSLTSFQLVVQPSYVATKSDVTYSATIHSELTAAGTSFSNTQAPGAILQLSGFVRNFDNADLSSMTVYGNGAGGPGPTTVRQLAHYRHLWLVCGVSMEGRSRCDFAGTIADGIIESDIYIDVTVALVGYVYRCTNWGNGDANYAYAVEFRTNSVSLQRGDDSSSSSTGTRVQIGTATLSLTTAAWHHAKVVFTGNQHTVYLDGVKVLGPLTDGTYSSGKVGFRTSNGSATVGYQGQWDNFGVMSVLSGTWTSASTSLTSATNYGNSVVTWQDVSVGSGTSILVESTINGGSSWQTVTNGGAIQNLTLAQALSGVSVKFRITLTTASASSMPQVQYFVARVLGQFSSSGTRISPALSLLAVGRAATALANWNALLPSGTSLTVQTSINGGSSWQTVASAGGAISGISTQPAPITDTFALAGNFKPRVLGGAAPYGGYAQGNFGGVTGTWFRDIANSRLVGTGGNYGTSVYATALTSADNQVIADFDEADGSGILTNYTATSSGYFVLIYDASAGGTPNTAKLYRRASSTNAQVGATATITFRRGTYHRFILDVQAGVLTVSMDGNTIITYTDGSPLGTGKSGFVLNALLRVYSLRIQQYGQDVTALSLLTKLTLNSTDSISTPQVLDLQAFVSSTDIGPGVLVPSISYQRKYVDKNIDDLSKKSLYSSYIRYDNTVVFQARTATPAPFVVSSINTISVGGQTLYEVLDPTELDNSGDSYRNRMVMQNAIATSTYTETLFGDGNRRAWNTSHPLSVPPTSILFNGQAATFGTKNIDTGKQFYYQIGSSSIDQDSSQVLLQGTDSFVITYTGTSSQDVVLDNTGQFVGTISQAQMATIENAAGGASSSGIVEAVIDASTMTVAEATVVANQELQRHGVIGRTFKFSTLHNGLLPGMQLPLFVSEYGFANAQTLIVEVDVTPDWANSVSGNILYTWKVTATEVANLGNWVKILAGFLTK